MGIEPTNRRLYLRLNDFEDRGGHQPAKHFRYRRLQRTVGSFVVPASAGFVPPEGLRIHYDSHRIVSVC